MAKIFEIFGYRVDDDSPEAVSDRANCHCPFMDRECDGGGNRHLSKLDLDDAKYSDELKEFFEERDEVPAGVCSIKPRKEGDPWIVCPRRLLVLGKEDMGRRAHQDFAESMLLQHSGFPSGAKLGVWAETTVKHATGSGPERKSFDYTFDYVVMPVERVESGEVERETGESWSAMRPKLAKAGYFFSMIDGEEFVENFPRGEPLVVEIMTSSTSGGNKNKRTTIPQAFEDAILGGEAGHDAPGINYRQVWGRMVSQLIVKSEAGSQWGGKTIWVLQDTLVDYISSSTALDLRHFISSRASEAVNILSFSYGDDPQSVDGVKELDKGQLFSGPVRPPNSSSEPGFQDMLGASVVPPKSSLIRALATRPILNRIDVP